MILSRRRKVQFIFLFLLMWLGGFAEVISISLIIPFLAVLIDPLQASQMSLVLVLIVLSLTSVLLIKITSHFHYSLMSLERSLRLTTLLIIL